MKNGKKILVVEEDQTWRGYLSDCLEQKSFSVVAVSTFDSAIEKVSNEKFDFITANMTSELTGWDLIESIYKMPYSRNLPVMVITGNPENYVREHNRITKGILLMEKGKFSRKQFIEIVNKELAIP